MLDIDDVMAHLAIERPVFHSEADFQHALAWEIHRRLPDAAIRLELPHALPHRPIHLDLWVRHGDAALAIELKYPTRAFVADIGGEEFALKNHGAQDLLRYDFIKDIQRVEQIVAGRDGVAGYAILLTNDPLIWRQGKDSSIDAAFHLWEGRTLTGPVAWAAHAGAGTTKGRETPLALHGAYDLRWRDYSQPDTAHDVRFRYLAVGVEAGSIPRAVLGEAETTPLRASATPTGVVPTRAKYAALTALLAANHSDRVTLTFAAIAATVGGLPESANQYREWWSNHAGNSQAHGWMDAGFAVETLDLSRRSVTFRRTESRQL
jgi:hypothetical protein